MSKPQPPKGKGTSFRWNSNAAHKNKVQPLTDEELFVLSRQWLTDQIAAGAVGDESYVKGTPHPKQKLFLEAEHDPIFEDQQVIEVLYGGAAGSGKTWAMLAAALKYVHIPNYSALLLRKNFPDLTQEGGLMALAHEVLQNTSAKWNENYKTYTFPSGATLRFGHLDNEMAKYRYQGGEYQFIGFDELTQFTETQYKYLMSRLRKRADIPVPLRMFSGTNPGGVGGMWVYERFVPEEDFNPSAQTEPTAYYKEHTIEGAERIHMTMFVPALMEDNPSLDRESYLESLLQLDELTRQQLLSGNWVIQVRGEIVHTYDEIRSVITWSQFEKVFGQRRIPSHWKVAVMQDWGSTKGHPCVTSWFATAAHNAPVVNGVPTAGMVFLYRGMMTTNSTAREMADKIKKATGNEMGQVVEWQMSHEAASERLEYNRQGISFSPWKTGRTRGIEQMVNAFRVENLERAHPFKPGLKGYPQLFLVVDDEELIYAKTDAGLARWRAEIPSYTWAELKSGEPTTRLAPKKIFDDAVDTVRSVAALYWPIATQKTLSEKVHDAVEAVQPRSFLESIDDPGYKAHVLTQRQILAEQAREKLKQVDEVLADWVSIG